MMVRGDDGKLHIGWKELAGLFLGAVAAATVPVATAMIVMYGDVREIKTNISTLKENDKEQHVTLRDHDQRLGKLERGRVEQ